LSPPKKDEKKSDDKIKNKGSPDKAVEKSPPKSKRPSSN
jgi:hypothetical protein